MWRATFITLGLFYVCLTVLVRGEEPQLVISPQESSQYAPTGGPYGLMCMGQAQGENDGAFTNMKWTNPSGKIIPKGTPGVKEYGLDKLKLSIVNSTANDSGTYTCTALYDSTKTLEAKVNLIFYDETRFEDCDPVQHLVLGQKGLISCRPVGNPQPNVNWDKNQHSVVQSDRLKVTPTGIEIPSVTREDEGIYTVEVFEPITNTNKFKNITVSVHDIKFENCDPIQYLKEDSKGLIRCRVVGVPQSRVAWDRNDWLLWEDKDRLKITPDGVEVFRPSRRDQALYVVKVYYTDDFSVYERETPNYNTSITVNVLTPPRVSRYYYRHFEAVVGDEFNLTCNAEEGSEPLTYTWFDQVPSHQRGKERMRERDLSTVEGFKVTDGLLTINPVQRDAAGNIKCKVSNPVGEDEANFFLEVLVRPIIEMENLTIEEGSTAVIECRADGVPRPRLTMKDRMGFLENIRDDRFALESAEENEISILRLRITDLKLTDEGPYFCEASSMAGGMKKTAYLEVQYASSSEEEVCLKKAESSCRSYSIDPNEFPRSKEVCSNLKILRQCVSKTLNQCILESPDNNVNDANQDVNDEDRLKMKQMKKSIEVTTQFCYDNMEHFQDALSKEDEICLLEAERSCHVFSVVENEWPGNIEELTTRCLQLNREKQCVAETSRNCSSVKANDSGNDSKKKVDEKDRVRINDMKRLLNVTTHICDGDSELHRSFVPYLSCMKSFMAAEDRQQTCRDYMEKAFKFIERLIESKASRYCGDHERVQEVRQEIRSCLRIIFDMNCFIAHATKACDSGVTKPILEIIENAGSLHDQCPPESRIDVIDLLEQLTQVSREEIYLKELLRVDSFS